MNVQLDEIGDIAEGGKLLKIFIVYYRHKNPGDKGPGPVRQFRINASNLDEAKRMVTRYANYPNIEVVSVRPA